MKIRFAAFARAAAVFRRHGIVAVLAAIALAAFLGLALIGTSGRDHDRARAADAAAADALDKARTSLDRQQRGLDELASIGATASDAEAQRFLDRLAGLIPGVRGAALADPAGAIELQSIGSLRQSVLAALAVDAAKQAGEQAGTAMLVTVPQRDDGIAIVGLARPWRVDGQLGGIAVVALDATAFPGLDLARVDGTPLFGAPRNGVTRIPLGDSPLALVRGATATRFIGWPFVAAAGIGSAALLGLLALLLSRLGAARREITRQNLVDRDLRAALAVASTAASRTDEVSRAKSQFFAQVTHELRTPLNAILGFSETIRGEIFGPVDNPRYLEYAGLIHDAGAHLLSLINDLLDEARIEAGKMEIVPMRVAAPALVRSALDLVEMLAEDREIAITTTGLSVCPDLNIDPRAMKQVLVNLLSNAIKYTPIGGHIDIGFAVRADGGAAIEIADSGIGMSPEDIDVAFEPFGRAGNSEVRRQQGTGLGLSLARALARLHGGDLALVSELDCGTTATVILPPAAVFAPVRAIPAQAA